MALSPLPHKEDTNQQDKPMQTSHSLYVVEALESTGWKPLHGYRPSDLRTAQSLHSYYCSTWTTRFYRVRAFR